MSHQRETNFMELWPVASTATSGTRVGQTTLEGALYRVRNPMEFNRIVWRATAGNNATTARILIYQGVRGTLDETFSLVAQATALPISAATTPGTFESAPDSAAIGSLVEGVAFVLFGRDSAGGSVTFRTHAIQATEFYTSQIPTNGIPSVFTTALSSTGTPASTITPTGFTASTSDLAPVIWTKKV